jgi:hypothetical protein
MTVLHLWAHSVEDHQDHHPPAAHRLQAVAPLLLEGRVNRLPAPPPHHDHLMHPDLFEIPASVHLVAGWHVACAYLPAAMEESASPVRGGAVMGNGRAPPYGHRFRAMQTGTLAVWRC